MSFRIAALVGSGGAVESVAIIDEASRSLERLFSPGDDPVPMLPVLEQVIEDNGLSTAEELLSAELANEITVTPRLDSVSYETRAKALAAADRVLAEELGWREPREGTAPSFRSLQEISMALTELRESFQQSIQAVRNRVDQLEETLYQPIELPDREAEAHADGDASEIDDYSQLEDLVDSLTGETSADPEPSPPAGADADVDEEQLWHRLPVRVRSSLERAGFSTIRSIRRLSDAELRRINGIGAASVREIRAVVPEPDPATSNKPGAARETDESHDGVASPVHDGSDDSTSGKRRSAGARADPSGRRKKGRVSSWKGTFGFVRLDDHSEVFVHSSEVHDSGRERSLREGDRVELRTVPSTSGKLPEARDVKLLERAPENSVGAAKDGAPSPAKTSYGASMPDVYGMTAREAREALRSVGLHRRLDMPSGSWDSQLVSFQYPSPGSILEPDNCAELHVEFRSLSRAGGSATENKASSGNSEPETPDRQRPNLSGTLEVPRLRWMSLPAAKQLVTEVGLQVKVEATRDRAVVRESNWVVKKQRPKPGTLVRRSSTVDLVVKKAHE